MNDACGVNHVRAKIEKKPQEHVTLNLPRSNTGRGVHRHHVPRRKTENGIKARACNVTRQMDIGKGHKHTERSGVQVGRSQETCGNNSARNY